MSNIGVIATGATLSYKTGGTYTIIPGLQEIPEMGGSRDKVEVTTLSDTMKRSIYGLTDMGELTFKFLYDDEESTSNYRLIKGLEDGQLSGGIYTPTEWKVTYPDGATHSFSALVHVKMDAVKVNSALGFNATMLLQTDITVVHPV